MIDFVVAFHGFLLKFDEYISMKNSQPKIVIVDCLTRGSSDEHKLVSEFSNGCVCAIAACLEAAE